MAWYLFEREKRYPFVPPERGATSDDWRMPVGVVLLSVGVLCALANVAGIFFPGWMISGWALPGALIGIGVGVMLTRS